MYFTQYRKMHSTIKYIIYNLLNLPNFEQPQSIFNVHSVILKVKKTGTSVCVIAQVYYVKCHLH